MQANSEYLSIVSLGQGYGSLGESLGSLELSKAADGKCTLLQRSLWSVYSSLGKYMGSISQSRCSLGEPREGNGSLGKSTCRKGKSMIWGVYGSLGHSTGSQEQSMEVCRVSTAV